jgi:hypothetical protein
MGVAGLALALVGAAERSERKRVMRAAEDAVVEETMSRRATIVVWLRNYCIIE